MAVNHVVPGVPATEAVARHTVASARNPGLTPDQVIARMMEKHPIPAGRVGSMDDVAATAMFLLSANTSWVTGACVAVDGGAHHDAFWHWPLAESVPADVRHGCWI